MTQIDFGRRSEVQAATTDVRLSYERLRHILQVARPGLLSALGSAETLMGGLDMVDDLAADEHQEG